MFSWFCYLFILIIIFFILLKSKFFKKSNLPTKYLLLLFLIKLFASFMLYIIYTKYYSHTRMQTDIFKYYDDGYILYNALKHTPLDFFKMLLPFYDNDPYLKQKYFEKMNFWIKPYKVDIINENKTLIRLNALIFIFSNNNYFTHVLIFIFLAFLGQYALFLFFKDHFPETNQYILSFPVFLMPSVLIWTSGILKESILFFGLGFSLYYLNSFIKSKKTKYLFLLIFFLFVTAISKFYVFLLLLPTIITFSISEFYKLSIKKTILIYSFIISLFLFLFFTSKYFTNIDLVDLVIQKQKGFIKFTEKQFTGSKIEIPILENNIFSFLINTPQALLNVVFRPTIFEFHNLMAFFSALENTFIFLLIIFTIIFLKKQKIKNIHLLCVTFPLLLFSLIGLVTPVLGALVRYKIPALPFFIILLISFLNFEKYLFNIKKLTLTWKK